MIFMFIKTLYKQQGPTIIWFVFVILSILLDNKTPTSSAKEMGVRE
jgi:hypothetical protein